jgi:hypothetical protein
MKVLAAVITSSPQVTSQARRPSFSASVPEPTPIACSTPIREAKRLSNSATGLPSVKSPEGTNSRSLASTESTSANCSPR